MRALSHPPRWRAWAAKIDARSQRERVMLLFVTLAVLYVLFQLAAYNPLRKYQALLQTRITTNQANLVAVQIKMQELREHISKDPNMPNRARISELTDRLNEASTSMSELMKSLVSPQDMPALVYGVLARHRELKVARVENIPFEELRPLPPPEESDKKAEPTSEADPLYKHGLLIEVEGEFREIVMFMRELEQMNWKVLWDTVDIRTERHPKSTAEISVYTLSRDDAWISL